ncbi:hypothetical protein SAMN05660909_02813 [Chitinophaga terrae (ex Kim and Jung 2007)]|uniref:Uncharacterized protein n=1 Tax=Chitinophaga terrae (ex Kim and Jung 2007) TaxID=408074 RepID=A0A1H4CUC4_9BACT|nr:hypothetical protein [Chitinophaga terrae (ex Kim and Jung 2007)]SEA63961.1 hypothetical protein SAMN05660909_02813 [Chitinophaga terrae (ex Kim and Jung 2007)]
MGHCSGFLDHYRHKNGCLYWLETAGYLLKTAEMWITQAAAAAAT